MAQRTIWLVLNVLRMYNFITWTADPVLIGSPVTIRWYGLMFVIGFYP